MAVTPAGPPTCEVCGRAFEPAAVYAQFLEDFARRAFVYDGKRPRWINRFCGEPCRYAAERARVKANNDRMSDRRMRERRMRKRREP